MRNNFLKMIVLVMFLTLFSVRANAKKDHVTSVKYDIEGVETGVQGTFLVKVYVYTPKGTATTEDFKYAAVHGVIFKGFSEKGFSNQKPMAGPEIEKQNTDYFDAFFNNGDYLSFADVVNPNVDRVRITSKEFKIAAIVSVSKDALRKTLEQSGIIRSLNSGF